MVVWNLWITIFPEEVRFVHVDSESGFSLKNQAKVCVKILKLRNKIKKSNRYVSSEKLASRGRGCRARSNPDSSLVHQLVHVAPSIDLRRLRLRLHGWHGMRKRANMKLRWILPKNCLSWSKGTRPKESVAKSSSQALRNLPDLLVSLVTLARAINRIAKTMAVTCWSRGTSIPDLSSQIKSKPNGIRIAAWTCLSVSWSRIVCHRRLANKTSMITDGNSQLLRSRTHASVSPLNS